MSLKTLKLLQSQLENATKAKCVEQIRLVTGQILRVYPSATAAAKFMGLYTSSIHKCCDGKVQTCGGFKWRFYDGPPLDCKYRSSNIQYNTIYKYYNITSYTVVVWV